VETRPVLLFETASNSLVEAVLDLRLTAEQVIAAEAVWKPCRDALGDEIEHGHWDWSLKTEMLAEPGARFLGVEYAGQMQGMMAIWESGRLARMGPDVGRPLVYVDFLEAAPWNLRLARQVPRYGRVGSSLIDEAVTASLALGWGGRIGLHALRGAEPFYEQKCGMASWGQDPGYNGLMYYEFTAEAAARYLAEE
jgi:hypothetical protein